MTKALAHLVYPTTPPFSAPGSIGFQMKCHLEDIGFAVRTYSWDSGALATPQSTGDILIGHPHPVPTTTFRKSAKLTGWKTRIAVMPMNGDVFQSAFAFRTLSRVDRVIALAGPEWKSYFEVNPLFRSLWHKTSFVNLTADPVEFKMLPRRSVPPDQRKVLYIGHTGQLKSPDYLEEVRELLPDVEFAWMGHGVRKLSGYVELGHYDLTSEKAREVLQDYHVLLTVGYADANPTTVVEAMGLGLVPICTRQSGWSESQGVIHVPFGDAVTAAGTVAEVLRLDVPSFERIVWENRGRLIDGLGWSELKAAVDTALVAGESAKFPSRAALLTRRERALLSSAAMLSPLNGVRWWGAHVRRGLRNSSLLRRAD